MSFIISVLSAIFALLHKGEPIERTVIGSAKKETFEINSDVYQIESVTIGYTIKSRFPFIPKTKVYGVIVKGRILKNNSIIELGSREYPLLVPRLFKGSRIAHIVARRRYLDDISEYLNNNKQL